MKIPSKNMIVLYTSESRKSGIMKNIVSNYKYWLSGFITRELRKNNERIGFEIKTVDGETDILASKSIVSSVHFNKYAINLNALENLAVNSINKGIKDNKIIIIDEIGSMTLISKTLANAVVESMTSICPVLVTVRKGAKIFEETFLKMHDTETVVLDTNNYYKTEKQIENWIEKWIKRGCRARL